jgi:hypothetical protein
MQGADPATHLAVWRCAVPVDARWISALRVNRVSVAASLGREDATDVDGSGRTFADPSRSGYQRAC